MKRTGRRRLSRLEKQIEPIIAERERREMEIDKRLRQAARDHATMVVAVLLHGAPQIKEPLRFAWWRARDNLGLTDIPSAQILDRLRALVVANLPGDTENAKFAHVLCSAPQWLLDFCCCHFDAHLLGFDLPENSEPVPEPGREGIVDRSKWPRLPIGTLEAGGPIFEPDISPLDNLPNPFNALNVDETMDLYTLMQKGEGHWSRQDRHRHREIIAKVRATNPIPRTGDESSRRRKKKGEAK
jgi:hypothetical protein